MDGPSPGSLFCSRSVHMEENQRSTDMATRRGKAIRLRREKMRRWTSPAWKERQAVLTENDDARGKKAAERRDGRDQWRSFSILTPRAAAIKAYIALGVRIG